jgi:hypothetical protein
MIVFDLDGTLADCEHRRHFVDERKNIIGGYDQARLREGWKPNWKAFYEACEEDIAITPTCEILCELLILDRDIVIWSGRCESVRKKTEEWLFENIYIHLMDPQEGCTIPVRMRPIGDSTPDDILKESWLDETIASGIEVDYVFDDRPKVVRMWRRRGIFVFDVNQQGKEF